VSERYPKNETVANSINTTILFSMARDAKGLKVALVVWVGDEPQLHSVMDFLAAQLRHRPGRRSRPAASPLPAFAASA
jgi:hypothetical protein